jgi:hypothetical protein
MLAAGVFEKIKLLCGDVVITGAAVRPYCWTLDDYEQLIALGLLFLTVQWTALHIKGKQVRHRRLKPLLSHQVIRAHIETT